MCARGTTSRRGRIALALALPFALLAAKPADASSPKGPAAHASPDESDRYDPENVTAISRFMETVVKGTERWLAKDTTGAIDTFKMAIQLRPKDPLGHLMLAQAYLGTGNLGEADAAVQRAVEESSEKNPLLHARVLFLRADVLERQKKWEDAKAAWQVYAEHAGRVPGAFPQTAVERIKAIQRVLDLERAYERVRERIEAEKKDAKK